MKRFTPNPLIISLLIFITYISSPLNALDNSISDNCDLVPPIVTTSYYPMAIEGACWLFRVDDEDAISYYGWRIEGDTLINGLIYKKGFEVIVYHVIAPPYEGLLVYSVDFSDPKFYMRDDTITKKVFVIYEVLEGEYNCQPITTVGEEVMIYDFAPNIDENIYCPDDQNIVSNIDTTEYFEYTLPRYSINNGERIQYQQIGDTKGLFLDINTSWVASYSEELIEYCVIDFEIACPHSLGPLSTIEIEDDLDVFLYPNPTLDKIIITSKEMINSIEIYSIDGRRIFHNPNVKSKFNEISLIEQTSQVFIALIRLENGHITRKHFTKN